MKTVLTILAVCFTLSGCEVKTEDKTRNFDLSGALSDCRIFNLQNSDGFTMMVVRCPNSTTSTTYKSGKTTQTTVVIDGVDYIKKE